MTMNPFSALSDDEIKLLTEWRNSLFGWRQKLADESHPITSETLLDFLDHHFLPSGKAALALQCCDEQWRDRVYELATNCGEYVKRSIEHDAGGREFIPPEWVRVHRGTVAVAVSKVLNLLSDAGVVRSEPVKGDGETATTPPAVDLNGCEQNIVEALQEYGALKAESLASRSGYPNNSNFRSTLAAMRKRGVIENTRSKGYHLPE